MTIVQTDPTQSVTEPSSIELLGLARVSAKWLGWLRLDDVIGLEHLLSRLVLDAGSGQASLHFSAHRSAVGPLTHAPKEWVEGDEAKDLIEAIGRGVHDIYSKSKTEEKRTSELAECKCRVFVDRTRLLSLSNTTTPSDEGIPAYATVDFRFHRVQKWDFLYITLAVQTRWPLGHTLAPALSASQSSPNATLTAEEASAWLGRRPSTSHLFWELLDGECQVAGLSETSLSIGGLKYGPPRFLIVMTSSKSIPSGLDWLESKPFGKWRVLEDLSRSSLHVKNIHSDGIAAGSISDALVLRNFDQRNQTRRPRYLILPQSFHDVAHEVPGVQEIEHLTETLIDAESEAAAYLWDFVTDADAYSNQVGIYANVGQRGAVLFDAIAFLLPVARGKRLQEVHDTIDLIQQTLLQSVADLGEVINGLQRLDDNLEQKTRELRGQCIEGLHEEPAPSRPSISGSITTTSYFEPAKIKIAKALAEAQRRKSANDDLLTAISLAIEDRRARETDRIAKLSVSFTAGITLVALLTATDLLWKRDPKTTGIDPGLLLVGFAVGLIVLCVLGSASWTWYRSRRGWPLTKGAYARRFESLRQLLRAASTDTLLRFAEERERASAANKETNLQSDDEWNKHDAQLAERLAMVIDDVFPADDHVDGWDWKDDMSPLGTSHVPMRCHQREDARLLRSRVEGWSLQALLVTERPRNLWNGKLPKLACLYRFCLYEFVLAGGKQNQDGKGYGDKLLRWDEFRLAMNNAGFSRIQTTVIDEWGRGHRGESARAVLAALNNIEMRCITEDDTASDEARQKIVDAMKAENAARELAVSRGKTTSAASGNLCAQ